MSQLASVKQEALDAAGVQLVVVGCGQHQLLRNYAENTGFQGRIYADPERALYRLFGMTETLAVTPAGQERKSYLAGKSRLGNALGSMWVSDGWRGFLGLFVGADLEGIERHHKEPAAPWQAGQHLAAGRRIYLWTWYVVTAALSFGGS